MNLIFDLIFLGFHYSFASDLLLTIVGNVNFRARLPEYVDAMVPLCFWRDSDSWNFGWNKNIKIFWVVLCHSLLWYSGIGRKNVLIYDALTSVHRLGENLNEKVKRKRKQKWYSKSFSRIVIRSGNRIADIKIRVNRNVGILFYFRWILHRFYCIVRKS